MTKKKKTLSTKQAETIHFLKDQIRLVEEEGFDAIVYARLNGIESQNYFHGDSFSKVTCLGLLHLRLTQLASDIFGPGK